MAWTPELHALHAVDYRLQWLVWAKSKDATANRNKPKPLQPPSYAHEKRAEQDAVDRKADAYRRRNRP